MNALDLPAARWHKSSHSGAEGGDCVEIALLAPAIAVRDSKNPDGPKLILDTTTWHTLTQRIKAGHHDHT